MGELDFLSAKKPDPHFAILTEDLLASMEVVGQNGFAHSLMKEL